MSVKLCVIRLKNALEHLLGEIPMAFPPNAVGSTLLSIDAHHKVSR